MFDEQTATPITVVFVSSCFQPFAQPGFCTLTGYVCGIAAKFSAFVFFRLRCMSLCFQFSVRMPVERLSRHSAAIYLIFLAPLPSSFSVSPVLYTYISRPQYHMWPFRAVMGHFTPVLPLVGEFGVVCAGSAPRKATIKFSGSTFRRLLHFGNTPLPRCKFLATGIMFLPK